MESHIYLIDFGEVVKVGVSKYPMNRSKNIARTFNLEIIGFYFYKTKNAYAIERMVKDSFAHKVKPWGGVTTETFSCSFDLIKEYITTTIDSIPEPEVEITSNDLNDIDDFAVSLEYHIAENYGSKGNFAEAIGTSSTQVSRYIKAGCKWIDGDVWGNKTKLNKGIK